MQKIAIGPGCPNNVIALEEDPDKNVTELSKALNNLLNKSLYAFLIDQDTMI